DRCAIVGHAENLRVAEMGRFSAFVRDAKYRPTFRMSATNICSARTRWSAGARSTADGCTVANTGLAHSESMAVPRDFMTLNVRPSSAFAAVAPRQTMTSG